MEFSQIYLELYDQAGAQITGDCADQDYTNAIEVLKWGWGYSLDAMDSSDARDGPRMSASRVGLSKPVDSASVKMLNLFASGARCKRAVLIMEQTTDEFIELRLTLNQVRLESFDLDVGEDDSEVTLTENWEFGYESMTLAFTSPDTKVNGQSVTKVFTLAKGVKVGGSAPESTGLSDLLKYPAEELKEAYEAKIAQGKNNGSTKPQPKGKG